MEENKANLSDKSSPILKKLIDMDPEDIGLKYIFDHIRNYGIASTMMIAGLYLWKHPESAFGVILSFSGFWSLILIGLFLNILNLTQIIWVLGKVKMPLGLYIFLMFLIFYIVLSFLASYAKYFMSIS